MSEYVPFNPSQNDYPRDLRGYGKKPPKANWPNGAAIAVQFVINYEEGGENCVLHGDAASEAFLSEIVGAQPWPGQRHWNMESIYEYGARAGFWRLRRLFKKKKIPATVYGVAEALKRSPDQVAAMQKSGWEIASHGLKWIEYKDATREEEMADIEKAIHIHEEVTGEKPRGWYTGRCSVNTVDLITETGQFDYVSDSYADDLPYWRHHAGRDQLIIPYTLDCNDMRFATPQGFNSGAQFYKYLKDTFKVLYREGKKGTPKMMNIGLHCRLAGRPGRIAALKKFIKYIQKHDDVWITTRQEIADHWHEEHAPSKAPLSAVDTASDETENEAISINIPELPEMVSANAIASEATFDDDQDLSMSAASMGVLLPDDYETDQTGSQNHPTDDELEEILLTDVPNDLPQEVETLRAEELPLEAIAENAVEAEPAGQSKNDAFIAAFGDIYEHSPWVAERAIANGPVDVSNVNEVITAMGQAFEEASDEERLAVLNAHPDLAGKLAEAKQLTTESTSEQASAGLDALTDDERDYFTALNETYKASFNFPFIIAVKGLNKSEILAAFENRLLNSVEQERATAEREVQRIARLRLEAMLA